MTQRKLGKWPAGMTNSLIARINAASEQQRINEIAVDKVRAKNGDYEPKGNDAAINKRIDMASQDPHYNWDQKGEAMVAEFKVRQAQDQKREKQLASKWQKVEDEEIEDMHSGAFTSSGIENMIAEQRAAIMSSKVGYNNYDSGKWGDK